MRGLASIFSVLILLATAPAIAQTTSCAAEGETIGSCSHCKTECCVGLTPASIWEHGQWQKDHVCGSALASIIPPGFGASCIRCGDGTCDSAHEEDPCNCPVDCK